MRKLVSDFRQAHGARARWHALADGFVRLREAILVCAVILLAIGIWWTDAGDAAQACKNIDRVRVSLVQLETRLLDVSRQARPDPDPMRQRQRVEGQRILQENLEELQSIRCD